MKSHIFFRHVFIIGFMCIFLVACKTASKSKTEITTLLETSNSWDGKGLPKYPDGKPKISILKVVIPSGIKLNLHKHSVINAAYILKGELTVITERKDTLYVKSGDAFSEVVNTWHYGINSGRKPVEIIVFYSGIEDAPNTILKQSTEK